jgi:cell division protein FtsI (penicillin-binding protein 3)
VSRRRHDEMRPHPWRRRTILTVWLLSAVAVTVRAGQIQIVQAADWAQMASSQHEGAVTLPAPRGTVFAANGVPLSVTRERVQIYVAPREVQNAEVVKDRLAGVLGLSPSRVEGLVSRGSGWNHVGLYSLAVRDSLLGLPGVHLQSLYQRYYPHGEIARGVTGVVIDGDGRGGIEQRYDGHLSGVPGSEVVARDSRGNPIPGQRLTVNEPRAGGEIVLTLDMELQEIAQSALMDAIDEHEALGGDILITDPHTGEIKALFSIRDGNIAALSAINAPFEPGSTLKVFTVAALLDNGLADLNDVIDIDDGRWTINGRTLNDTHVEAEHITLRTALSESSNVGIAKAALALPEGLQFQNLRDFGFGTMTGIELPGEVAGTLYSPDRWSLQSPQSLAIGYEMSATPLQMAMAYGAIANGGVLMRPRLVQAVRDANGTIVERFDPQEIRRVVSRRTAEQLGRALVEVVDNGTGGAAGIGSYQVAGKSGTARFATNGRYERGDYSSSFVGYFPADDPQLVIFVKLDRPGGGAYYGGAVAAPVTRVTMEAALAANVLNLDKLAGAAQRPVVVVPSDFYTQYAATDLSIPLPPESPEGQDAGAGVAVPDVSGLPTRSAIRELHKHGLRVAEVGPGAVIRTFPTAGSVVTRGDVVRLRYRGQDDE